MSESNNNFNKLNNFNELNNFMNQLNENNLFDINCISNIKILSDSANNKPLDEIIKHSDAKIKISSNKLSSKNNKRPKCGICKVKINVVDELISTCKCNKLHCLKHRMPETHNCEKMKAIGEEQRNILESSLIKLGGKFEPVRI